MAVMRTSIPRVRSVRLKAGGEVRVFRGGVEIEAEKAAERLRDAHACYQTLYRADMAGFVLVVWDAQGRNTSAHHVAPTSPVGSMLLPTYVAEKLRRVLAEADATEMVKRMFNPPQSDA